VIPGARHELFKAKKKEGGHPARLVRCRGLEARAPFPVCNTRLKRGGTRCAILFRTIGNGRREARSDFGSTAGRGAVVAATRLSQPDYVAAS